MLISIKTFLGKRGRTTIPKEIRRAMGLRHNDILKYTYNGGDTLEVKLVKECDNCAGKQKKNEEMTAVQTFLKQMPAEFRKMLLEYLLTKDSEVE